MKYAVLFFIAASSLSAQTTKPVVFISGNGLTNIQANGVGAASHGVAAGSGSASVGKTDGAMQLSRILLKDCPGVEVTLDDKATPDYYMGLNIAAKAGFIWTVEMAQLMVLNSQKSPIYSEQGTANHLTKKACKAIVADWKAHGTHSAQAKTPESNWNFTKP